MRGDGKNCGMNSVHEALFYGVPMVTVPRQMEQLFNGRIVVESDAGIRLFAPVTADTLRPAVGHMLAAAGGYQDAGDAIERYVRSVMPA